MALLALDFDGVICDSATETGASGWRCAWKLWPSLMKTPEISPEFTAGFLKVRPYLETGFQSAIMVRLLVENAPISAFQNLEGETARILSESGLTKEEMIHHFAETRDQWIREDEKGWLKAHRCYEGCIPALQSALAYSDVRILTTKQERFVRLMLENCGVDFPADKIWGLDAKRPKEEHLESFVHQGAKEIFFVEDRLPTLLRVLDRKNLPEVHLFYAEWGYGTPAEIEQARQHPAITCIQLPEFLQILKQNR